MQDIAYGAIRFLWLTSAITAWITAVTVFANLRDIAGLFWIAFAGSLVIAAADIFLFRKWQLDNRAVFAIASLLCGAIFSIIILECGGVSKLVALFSPS